MPKLDRRMYGHRPDEPEIVQENDVDGSFVDAPVGIPADLLAIIHEPRSVDPEPIEPVMTPETESLAEENPNSRFRVLNVALKKPGTCFVCKSDGGDERQFVDTGQTIEWFGAVYFCTFCVTEVAKILDLMPTKERDAYIAELEERSINANSMAEAFQEQLNAARLLLRNCRCGDSDSSDSVPDSVPVDVEPDSEPEQNNYDADESGDVEEPGDVPESPMDDDAEPEPESKPKRARRASSNS